MGECYFYMKAQFPSEKILTKVYPKIIAFLKEGQQAQEWWQEHRNNKPAKFWKPFQTNFPIVSQYLIQANLFGKDCNNDLAGNLEFGYEGMDKNADKTTNEFHWSAEVWHMGSWEHFPKFFQTQFGASKVVWGSEENGCGSIDGVELYDYETIIKDILKHTEVLPTLLGINDELDTLIEVALKKPGRKK